MSYIKERKQQAELLKREICRLLKWDELQYCEFQYRYGCEYLQHFLPGDPVGIDLLLKQRLYWNWWKNQWHNRDHAFLASVALHLVSLTMEDLTVIYTYHHDVRILVREISPNGIILSSSYKIVGGVVKSEVL
jgi:hypothetical protein